MDTTMRKNPKQKWMAPYSIPFHRLNSPSGNMMDHYLLWFNRVLPDSVLYTSMLLRCLRASHPHRNLSLILFWHCFEDIELVTIFIAMLSQRRIPTGSKLIPYQSTRSRVAILMTAPRVPAMAPIADDPFTTVVANFETTEGWSDRRWNEAWGDVALIIALRNRPALEPASLTPGSLDTYYVYKYVIDLTQ